GPPPEGMGLITAAHYEQGSGEAYISCGAGTIKNCTSLPAEEVAAAAAAPLPFEIEVGSDQPQVLIMHTHATESYELEDLGWFDPEYTCRRTDTTLNMVAVGAAIAEQLNGAGIVTLQDATLHDYPSYNGSYERSNATVRAYLEKYPSIKVVLDVHRDAIETDGARVKAVAEVDGETAAQVMIICGADKGGNLPNFKQNLAFAAKWENALESRYPGLTRPVLFDYRYYNQDLTTGSLLIEMGSHGNTLAEAVYSGELVGKALAGLFTTEA
ncbi:MAG TPA: stage II sporulation protein P, partial [Candidatus Fournierella merdigallinarum]|nr:stage II sporulation protein P [Candidatus Fournierella merdigallinarum]